MLTAHKLKIIHDLINSSTKEELIWLNGIPVGHRRRHNRRTPKALPVKQPAIKITIAYGTESGNSKKLAADFAARAKKNGIQAKLVSLDQYRLNDLVKEEYFFTVISTQGEGEPPAAAKKFYDHIHQNDFKLDKLKYSVLALGDTAYPLFCKAGEDVDIQLQQLGGQRIVSLQRCDIDYEDEAGNWFAEVLQKINSNGNGHAITKQTPRVAKKPGGKKIYTGTVIANINLNDRGSNKQTHHIEIAAEDADYQPGDSIGIVPENPIHLADAVIALAGIDRHKLLVHRNEEINVLDLLKKKLNIVYLPERVVKKYATIVQQDIPETKMGLSDLLRIYPVKNAAQFEEVIASLEPTAPRLYSVSSSPQAHTGEVHLTVAKDFFCINEEVKQGLCSHLLAELPVDGKVEFYIHKNGQFKLPAANKDMIMIGPGTGVAPFRSFLAERDASGATGRNWLFFGDQHFASDFLYQTEMQSWLQSGVLTKISLAFSRGPARENICAA